MRDQSTNKAQPQSKPTSAPPSEFAERKIVFLDEIRSWVEDRRADERLTRKQIGELDGLGRLQAQRRSLLDNIAHFYARHSNADAAPGVLILITFYSDNNDGCCSLSVTRMAKFLSRSERRVSDAFSRLEDQKLIAVEPVVGKTSRIYPWVHKSFALTNDPLTWILELRSPSTLKHGPGRPRNTPDASVTPISETPDTDEELPLTPVTNTPDTGDVIPLTPASPNTTNIDTTRNTTKGKMRAREEPPSASPIAFKDEVKDGVAHLEHAMRAQNFGSPPKEKANWYAWRDHLATSALVRAVSKNEAFELASVARSKTDYWPAASQIIKALEMHAERLRDRDRRLAEYERKQPRFDEWQRQTRAAVEIQEAAYAETADNQGRRELIVERLRAAGINLREFEADQFDLPTLSTDEAFGWAHPFRVAKPETPAK